MDDEPMTVDTPRLVADLALQSAIELPRPARPARGGRRLVAIDGPAGSGKTSLARDLHAELIRRDRTATVLHLDDLYDGWRGLDDALVRRVGEQLVEPFLTHRPARWQRYEWSTGRFAEWHDLPDVEVIVVEGCGAASRGIREHASVSVWVEAPPAERIARGLARDGADVEPQWLAWTALEAAHFARHETRAACGVRLRT